MGLFSDVASQAMMALMIPPRMAVAAALVASLVSACTGGSPTPTRSHPGPVPSEVISTLHLRATPTPSASVKVSEAMAVKVARDWLTHIRAWRTTASTRATLARLTDFGLHDEPAWLVYAQGVVFPGTVSGPQQHVLVVVNAETGKRLGDYSY